MVSLGGIIVQLNQVRSDFALVELSKKLGIHFRFIIGDFFFLKKSCGLVTQFEFIPAPWKPPPLDPASGLGAFAALGNQMARAKGSS